MKAKEYAAKFDQDLIDGKDPIEITTDLLKSLFDEAYRVGLSRYNRGPKVPDHIMVVALREQDQKWRSIANATGYLKPNAFTELLLQRGISIK